MRHTNLTNIVWKEGKQYVSWNINTGVSSFGDTKKEALESIQEALELYLEDLPVSKITKVGRPVVVPLVIKHA